MLYSSPRSCCSHLWSTEMWIPLTGSPKPAVTREHVQFLESPPQRAHVVIGIITPPSGKYETEAEAVKAMRREAAKHGADAIYVESQTQEGGWRFSFGGFGGPSGGRFSDLTSARRQSYGSRSDARPLSEFMTAQQFKFDRFLFFEQFFPMAARARSPLRSI